MISFFWIFYANIWYVGILVFVMVISNPGTITDNFKSNGGEFHAGLVLAGDRLFHVVTIFIVSAYLWFRVDDFIEIFYYMFARDYYVKKEGDSMLIIYVMFMATLATIPFFLYYNAFDFEVVYNVDISIWIGITIIVSMTILTVIVPILYISLTSLERHKKENAASWSFTPLTPSVEDLDVYEKNMQT